MPQLKERTLILRKIDHRIGFVRSSAVLCVLSSEESEQTSSESSNSDDKIAVLEARRRILGNSRYTHKRSFFPKSSHSVHSILNKLNDTRFKEDVRMSREAFSDLVNRLSTHRVFSNASTNPQRPIELQLMVALYRSGCSGNGVGVGKVARHFGVSEGAVGPYTNRVIVTLLSIEQDVVFWPDSAEKKSIKKRIVEQSAFPNCQGFVDGTLITFADKPNTEGSDYFSHKSRYGINTLLVCHDQKRIRYLFAGFCVFTTASSPIPSF